jgi:hypothetical protein
VTATATKAGTPRSGGRCHNGAPAATLAFGRAAASRDTAPIGFADLCRLFSRASQPDSGWAIFGLFINDLLAIFRPKN